MIVLLVDYLAHHFLDDKNISFSDVSALDFAKQITVYQQTLWQRVSAYDLLLYKPPNPDAEEDPNVRNRYAISHPIRKNLAQSTILFNNSIRSLSGR